VQASVLGDDRIDELDGGAVERVTLDQHVLEWQLRRFLKIRKGMFGDSQVLTPTRLMLQNVWYPELFW
jgi:hypothetical protein